MCSYCNGDINKACSSCDPDCYYEEIDGEEKKELEIKYVDSYEEFDTVLRDGLGVYRNCTKEYLRSSKLFEIELYYSNSKGLGGEFYGKLTRATLFFKGEPILKVEMERARFLL